MALAWSNIFFMKSVLVSESGFFWGSVVWDGYTIYCSPSAVSLILSRSFRDRCGRIKLQIQLSKFRVSFLFLVLLLGASKSPCPGAAGGGFSGVGPLDCRTRFVWICFLCWFLPKTSSPSTVLPTILPLGSTRSHDHHRQDQAFRLLPRYSVLRSEWRNSSWFVKIPV